MAAKCFGRSTGTRDRLTGLLAALFICCVASLANAAPTQLQALVDPPSQQHHPGKVVFVELITPDLAAAKTFYAGLFGWSFRDRPFGSVAYAEATLENRPVAGLLERPFPAGEHRQPAWLGFFSVGNVDVAAKTALQNGGKVLFQPHDVPNLGRDAVIQDPQGAVFGILASSSGDPPDYLAGAGEWIWSSLITTDPDAAAGFYQALFDYEVFAAADDRNGHHLIVASDNYARASVNSLPGNGFHSYPYWLNYVRVEDAAKVAAKAVSLGGRVVVEPRPDRQGSKVAVVADPAGAVFGLLEWPESDSKVVTK
jgi:predicted enzyme related to lactoylglutathione lyase